MNETKNKLGGPDLVKVPLSKGADGAIACMISLAWAPASGAITKIMSSVATVCRFDFSSMEAQEMKKAARTKSP